MVVKSKSGDLTVYKHMEVKSSKNVSVWLAQLVAIKLVC